MMPYNTRGRVELCTCIDMQLENNEKRGEGGMGWQPSDQRVKAMVTLVVGDKGKKQL